MISLEAWMTVSMSALSKLSTTKRPRCAAGTSGAVGPGRGSVGRSTRGGSCGASARGPMEAGGTGESGAGAGGGGGVTVTTRGGAGGGAGGRVVAHPARSVSTQTAAARRFMLLLRLRRRLDAFARRREGGTIPQARRETPAGGEGGGRRGPGRRGRARGGEGSSRYAIGFVSRRTTPCRFGFGPPRRAPVVAVAGASLRVGLKRLRLAMTLYALTGAWGTGGRPAGPLGGVTGRGRPVSGGGAQTSCWTMKATQKRPTPPSRTLRMSRRLGIRSWSCREGCTPTA